MKDPVEKKNPQKKQHMYCIFTYAYMYTCGLNMYIYAHKYK